MSPKFIKVWASDLRNEENNPNKNVELHEVLLSILGIAIIFIIAVAVAWSTAD